MNEKAPSTGDRAYLQHMRDAANMVLEYTRDLNEQQFFGQKMAQSAVIRELEIIGEAAKRVSPKTRSRSRHIPWRDIMGMRDRLIHEYMGVDLYAVWATVVHDVPVLIRENSCLKERSNRRKTVHALTPWAVFAIVYTPHGEKEYGHEKTTADLVRCSRGLFDRGRKGGSRPAHHHAGLRGLPRRVRGRVGQDHESHHGSERTDAAEHAVPPCVRLVRTQGLLRTWPRHDRDRGLPRVVRAMRSQLRRSLRRLTGHHPHPQRAPLALCGIFSFQSFTHSGECVFEQKPKTSARAGVYFPLFVNIFPVPNP